ncbi:MAG: hypothetical protein QOH50_925 [Kribbellaceae bacterium]|nr:hypothetical protein [Kribbellaceae bacterium]
MLPTQWRDCPWYGNCTSTASGPECLIPLLLAKVGCRHPYLQA